MRGKQSRLPGEEIKKQLLGGSYKPAAVRIRGRRAVKSVVVEYPAGQRGYEDIKGYLETVRKLKVNEDKREADKPGCRKLLVTLKHHEKGKIYFAKTRRSLLKVFEK